MVTLKDAKEAADSIVDALQPVLIVLFGSVAAEGTGTDLDLLVVIDDRLEEAADSNLLVHRCLKRFYKRFAIDPFVVHLSLFNEYYAKGSPFLRVISKEGRLLYMRDAVQEWLKQAEEELNMANYLLQGGYLKGTCYHAQQSVEKSLKAWLFTKGWELEKTHSVERLVAIGEDYKLKFNLSDEEIVFIDSIYRGRYPADEGLLPFGEPSKEDAERAAGIARRIFKDVQDAVKRRSG
jgi:HEPN domain-containing protein/predicted nucleotidyltransferase